MNKHLKVFETRLDDLNIFKNIVFNTFVEMKQVISERKKQYLEIFDELNVFMEEIKQDPEKYFNHKLKYELSYFYRLNILNNIFEKYIYNYSFDYKSFFHHLKLNINKNESFRNNYLLYYTDYVNYLSLDDVRDILLSCDKYDKFEFRDSFPNGNKLDNIKFFDLDFDNELEKEMNKFSTLKSNILIFICDILNDFFKNNDNKELICSNNHLDIFNFIFLGHIHEYFLQNIKETYVFKYKSRLKINQQKKDNIDYIIIKLK